MRVLTSLCLEEWSEFIQEHPFGNIFQTPEMNQVYAHTKNYEPVVVAVVDDENSEILSFLQAVVINEVNFLRKLTSRSVIQGGPLIAYRDKRAISSIKILFESFDKIVGKKAIYTEIRNMWDTSDVHQTFYNIGYMYTPHVNFLIDLSASPEEIFSNFKRDKKRAIKKAKKSGIKIKQANTLEEIEAFYKIISETYKTANLPKPPRSLFFSVFEILKKKNLAKFFLASFDGEVIAGRLVLCYKGTIFDWYAGAKKDFLNLRPNELLVWHVLKWGSENNYSTFDFGGAGNPKKKYGVRDFKRQFGGQMVEFGRYKKVYSPRMLKLLEKGLNIYKLKKLIK